MAKLSKKQSEQHKLIEPGKLYSFAEGVELMKKAALAKFDESVEVHVKLNVDPRHADQQVRSTLVLPHGTGKTKTVLVLTAGDTSAAKEAGADFIGGADMVEKIKGGWLDFDAVIATPDMMRFIGPLGKVLGPRGLMPSAKAGTVTANVGDAVREIKAGRVEFRVDKFAITHNVIGKISFSNEQLLENLRAYHAAIVKARPAAVKGTYIKSMTIASTMGPGIRLDESQAE